MVVPEAGPARSFFVWKIGSQWRAVGISLGLGRETLEAIADDYRKSDDKANDKANAVLSEVSRLKGRITCRALLTAIGHAGLTRQVEAFPQIIDHLERDPSLLARLKADPALLDRPIENGL